MLPRPAWLAIGVMVGAGVANYLPVGGGSAGVLAALGVTLALAAGGGVASTASRGGLAPGLVAASVGAALIATRLVIGLAGGGDASVAPTLPSGTGPWQSTVNSARETNGTQIATISLAESAAGATPKAAPLTCSAQMPAYPRLIAGDSISWSGSIRALTSSSYDQYLAAQGISANCQATDLTVLSHDDSPAGRLEALRQASGDALQKVLPEPGGGLAAAILIGLRDRVDRDLAAAFTTAGVSHIVAISGWNISIVAAVVAALLRSRVGRRSRALVTILAIVAYTLFAGASPSVMRAAVMAGVAMVAAESGRGPRAMVGLAWAMAIMILVEPSTVADVGFQLSAAGTAGLVAWGSPLTAWIRARAPRLPAALCESLGVSLAAQASTLPIALLTFGRLAAIAPAANLVAVPLVPPVMAAGAIAFAAGWLATLGAPTWLTGVLAMPASLLLQALIAVVRVAAAVPGANETLPFPANVAGAAVAIVLLLLMRRELARASRESRPRTADARPRRASPRLRPRHKWALAGAALLVVLTGSVVAARPDGSVHVIVLDVGQGDSILLEGDRGGRILVDGGPDPNVLMADLDHYIPTWDRRLDAIILTHPHDDHVAGLVAVVERYQVGRAFESGWAVDTPAYRAWKSALAARGLEPERLSTGETLRLDDATLQVLWPDDGTTRSPLLDPAATSNRQINDASVVLLGEYEGRRFLLTGDTEDDVDPILLSRGLPTLDMLKVAHHGSATASSDVLLATVRPSIAVISVGAKNMYGHPNAATVARLRAHSTRVARTDQEGTVEVTLDRVAVTVETDRTAPDATGGARAGRAPAVVAASALRLLYDAPDVNPQPARECRTSPFPGTTCLAPASCASRGRDGRLAGGASGGGRPISRSPPGGSGRTAA
jgi:competence protein ComEC